MESYRLDLDRDEMIVLLGLLHLGIDVFQGRGQVDMEMVCKLAQIDDVHFNSLAAKVHLLNEPEPAIPQ